MIAGPEVVRIVTQFEHYTTRGHEMIEVQLHRDANHKHTEYFS